MPVSLLPTERSSLEEHLLEMLTVRRADGREVSLEELSLAARC